MKKIIVAGSRGFDDYDHLGRQIIKHLGRFDLIGDPIEIVSGGARGADALGERYANEMGCQLKKFPADWDKHGKSAGYIRNEEMAKYADHLIAFWDAESRGTHHMIKLAKKHGLFINVVIV